MELGYQNDAGGGMHYCQNTRGQIESLVVRREDKNSMKRIMSAEVNGRRNRGRQKKRWGDMIQQDNKASPIEERRHC